MRWLIDLNVVLDVLLDRAPHADAASAVWAAVETGRVEGRLAAHSVTTLHYLASRSGGRAFGDRCVSDVLTVFGVAGVDRAVLQDALALKWPDFEDAVCAAAAHAAGCHAIVTRDPKGFRKAALPVWTPAEALVAPLPTREGGMKRD